MYGVETSAFEPGRKRRSLLEMSVMVDSSFVCGSGFSPHLPKRRRCWSTVHTPVLYGISQWSSTGIGGRGGGAPQGIWSSAAS